LRFRDEHPVRLTNGCFFNTRFAMLAIKYVTAEEKRNTPPEDFAGPNKSFPITSQEKLNSAARLAGHAGDPNSVRNAIIRIAHRKGYRLPKKWEKKTRDRNTHVLNIYKDINNDWRWITFSSSSYVDRDGEICSQQAQIDDVARMNATKDFGALCWWHLNGISDKMAVKLGTCDYAEMVGRIRVESGTFVNDLVAKAINDNAAELGVSIGYSHNSPNRGVGTVFDFMVTRERSLLPIGTESNPLTQVFVKETNQMSKLAGLKALFGGGKEADALVAALVSEAATKEQQAQDLKLAYKAAPPPPVQAATAAAPATLATCPECGAPITKGATACKGCGKALKADGMLDPTEISDEIDGETESSDYAAELSIEAFHQELDKVITQAIQSNVLQPLIDAIGATLSQTQVAATKERDALTSMMSNVVDALKEHGIAVNTAFKERDNRIVALEKELASLKGEQPIAQKYRASLNGTVVEKAVSKPTASSQNSDADLDPYKLAAQGMWSGINKY